MMGGMPPMGFPPGMPPSAQPPMGMPPGMHHMGMMPPGMMQPNPLMPGGGPAAGNPTKDWTEHKAKDGRVYFFNTRTKQSSWEKPKEVRTLTKEAPAPVQMCTRSPSTNVLTAYRLLRSTGIIMCNVLFSSTLQNKPKQSE